LLLLVRGPALAMGVVRRSHTSATRSCPRPGNALRHNRRRIAGCALKHAMVRQAANGNPYRSSRQTACRAQGGTGIRLILHCKALTRNDMHSTTRFGKCGHPPRSAKTDVPSTDSHRFAQIKPTGCV
jgi:hypothetical protein